MNELKLFRHGDQLGESSKEYPSLTKEGVEAIEDIVIDDLVPKIEKLPDDAIVILSPISHPQEPKSKETPTGKFKAILEKKRTLTRTRETLAKVFQTIKVQAEKRNWSDTVIIDVLKERQSVLDEGIVSSQDLGPKKYLEVLKQRIVGKKTILYFPLFNHGLAPSEFLTSAHAKYRKEVLQTPSEDEHVREEKEAEYYLQTEGKMEIDGEFRQVTITPEQAGRIVLQSIYKNMLAAKKILNTDRPICVVGSGHAVVSDAFIAILIEYCERVNNSNKLSLIDIFRDYMGNKMIQNFEGYTFSITPENKVQLEYRGGKWKITQEQFEEFIAN